VQDDRSKNKILPDLPELGMMALGSPPPPPTTTTTTTTIVQPCRS
jgi:hypothetical protein